MTQVREGGEKRLLRRFSTPPLEKGCGRSLPPKPILSVPLKLPLVALVGRGASRFGLAPCRGDYHISLSLSSRKEYFL